MYILLYVLNTLYGKSNVALLLLTVLTEAFKKRCLFFVFKLIDRKVEQCCDARPKRTWYFPVSLPPRKIMVSAIRVITAIRVRARVSIRVNPNPNNSPSPNSPNNFSWGRINRKVPRTML